MTWVALVQSPVDQCTKGSASSLVIVFSLGSSPGAGGLKLQDSVSPELPICSVVGSSYTVWLAGQLRFQGEQR